MREGSDGSGSYLEMANRPTPNPSHLMEATEIPWPADGWHKHFIDFCIQCRRDLIEIWRFLTSVSASQQGCCCAKQPRLCHPLPNTLSCWEHTCRKQRTLPERDALAHINHAHHGGIQKQPSWSGIHALVLNMASSFRHLLLNKPLLVYIVPRGQMKA